LEPASWSACAGATVAASVTTTAIHDRTPGVSFPATVFTDAL
jgi:hypothetical protein